MRKAKLLNAPSLWGLILLSALPVLPLAVKVMGHALAGGSSAGLSVEASREAEASISGFSAEDVRFELLVSLDLLLRAERVLHQEEGAYSAALGRVPQVLGPSTAFFNVEITRATRDKLLLTARGAPRGNWVPLDLAQTLSQDLITVNEQAELRTNFSKPVPPAAYLRALAQTVMHRISLESSGRVPEEQIIHQWEGLFAGHFEYQNRAMSSGETRLVATPVTDIAKLACSGVDITYSKNSENIYTWIYNYRLSVFGDVEARNKLQSVLLAQKTRARELGGYAESLEDLRAFDGVVTVLRSPLSSVQLDGLNLDAQQGFHADIVLLGEQDHVRNLWTINSFGQTTRFNPVEDMMGKLQNVHRALEPKRRVSSEAQVQEPRLDEGEGR